MSGRHIKKIALWLPFLVPLLYLGLIFWLQAIDRPGEQSFPEIGRSVYDNYDLTAMALRGLNASVGRVPGRIEQPEEMPEGFERSLDERRAPASRFFLEYPAAALFLFRLGFSLQDISQPVPAGILDARYHDIVAHVPRNEEERKLWAQIRLAIWIYIVVMVFSLLTLMMILRQGYEPQGGLSGPIVLMILPGALYFSANRFDIVPALLMAGSLFCLGRRWTVASGGFLAAATMVKVYPLLLVPLVVRYLAGERRRAFLWALSFGATCLAMTLPPLWHWGWDATLAPYRFQLSRVYDPGGGESWGSFYWAWILPEFLAGNDFLWRGIRGGIVLLLALGLCWSRPLGMAGLLRRGAVVLIVFTALQVFFSPQWILWFSPLLVPLVRLHRSLFWLAAGLDVATYLIFPIVWDEPPILMEPEWLYPMVAVTLTYLRFLILCTIIVICLWREFRPYRSSEIGLNPTPA